MSQSSEKPPPTSQALPTREAMWDARAKAEQAGWDLGRRFEADMRQLLETLRRQIEKSERRLRAEVEELAARFDADTEERLAQIYERVEKERQEVHQATDEAIESLRRESIKSQEEIHQAFSMHQEELTQHERQLKVDLGGQVQQLKQTFKAKTKSLQNRRPIDPSSTVKSPPQARKEKPRPVPRRDKKSSAIDFVRHRLSRSRRAVFVSLLMVIVGGGSAIAYLSLLSGRHQISSTAQQPSPEPPSPESGDDQSQRQVSTLIDRVREEEVTSNILNRALADEDLADPASALFLKLTHGLLDFAPRENCVFLQAALFDVLSKEVSHKKETFPLHFVDGKCYQQTLRTLKYVKNEESHDYSCCSSLEIQMSINLKLYEDELGGYRFERSRNWEELIWVKTLAVTNSFESCFMYNYLHLNETGHPGCREIYDWPISKERELNFELAERLLGLVRIANRSGNWHGFEEFDLAENPEAVTRLSGLSMNEADAHVLVRILYSELYDKPYSGSLRIAELDSTTLEALLKEIE